MSINRNTRFTTHNETFFQKISLKNEKKSYSFSVYSKKTFLINSNGNKRNFHKHSTYKIQLHSMKNQKDQFLRPLILVKKTHK
jgi:hypothetical protein